MNKVTTTRKPRNYINNKSFYTAMIEHKSKTEENKRLNKNRPQISNYIGECILKICTNLSKKPNFNGYSSQWKQEMISDAIIDCVAAIDNFNPDKTNNPFAYFTQIAWNAFIRRIHKEKKETYIKLKNYEKLVLSGDVSDFHNPELTSNEYSDHIVRDFEEKLLTERNKIAKLKEVKKNEDIDNEE